MSPCAHRYVELQVRIDAVRLGSAHIVGHAAAAQDRPGDAVRDRLLAGEHADADGAIGQDLVRREQVVRLLDSARQPLVDQLAQVLHGVEFADALVEQVGRAAHLFGKIRRHAAEAEVVAHHAAAGDGLEEVQDRSRSTMAYIRG